MNPTPVYNLNSSSPARMMSHLRDSATGRNCLTEPSLYCHSVLWCSS